MLTHELNNFTMQKAVNWYLKLKSAFKVSYINYNLVRAHELMSFVIVYRACQRGVEHQPAVPQNQLVNPFIFSTVINIYSHYHNSIPSFTLIPHSDISGQLTATGSASPSSFGRLEWLWLRSKGGALGMPAVSGGLVSAIVAAVAFVGGIARVIAWALYTAMDLFLFFTSDICFEPMPSSTSAFACNSGICFPCHSYNLLVIYSKFSVYWDYSVRRSFMESYWWLFRRANHESTVITLLDKVSQTS